MTSPERPDAFPATDDEWTLAARYVAGELSDVEAAAVKDRLSIAVRLRPALENQLAGGLERDALVKMGRHRPVKRVAGVLAVDHLRHAPHGRHHFFLVAEIGRAHV